MHEKIEISENAKHLAKGTDTFTQGAKTVTNLDSISRKVNNLLISFRV